CQKYSSPPYNF
nr:immunoglobulin light chain junction region [Macaca mulatta]